MALASIALQGLIAYGAVRFTMQVLDGRLGSYSSSSGSGVSNLLAPSAQQAPPAQQPPPAALPAEVSVLELGPLEEPALLCGTEALYLTTLERGGSGSWADLDPAPLEAAPLISLGSFFTLRALAQACGAHAVAFYDPADFPSAAASPLVAGSAALVAQAGGLPPLQAQLPALRYAPLSFDALVGRWLRPHTSGRHVALRGLALLASAAQCSGLAPPAVLARLHDGTRDSKSADYQPPNTDPEHELPPLLVQPRECPALQAALALPPAGGLLLMAYLRPGLALGGLGGAALAALRGGAPPGTPGLTALHALPAPGAALLGYTSCLLGAGALPWPTLAQAATAELNRRFRLDVLDPSLSATPLAPLGALLLVLSGSGGSGSSIGGTAQGAPLLSAVLPAYRTWDDAALSASLGCLQEEACSAARGSLHEYPGLRAEAVLAASLRRSEELFSVTAGGGGAGAPTWPATPSEAATTPRLVPLRTTCYHNATLHWAPLSQQQQQQQQQGLGQAPAATRMTLAPAHGCSAAQDHQLWLQHWSGSPGVPAQAVRSAWAASSTTTTATATTTSAQDTPRGDGGGQCWGGAPGSIGATAARTAHRQWAPRWSGYTPAEMAAAGTPTVPAPWGHPSRALFAHLIMGENPDTARLLAGCLASGGASVVVVVGCWGTEADPCAVLQAEGAARVTQSLLGTTFSVGRNRNQLLIPHLELQQGHLFEYIAHWDEDMVILGACGAGAEPSEALLRVPLDSGLRGGVGPGTPVEVGGGEPSTGPACARALEAWVLALMPAIAVPNLGYPLPGPYAWQRVYNFDSQSTFFHRRAVDALLPYDTPFERYSYYSGPSAMQHLAGTVYWGAVVAVNLVFVHNPQHRGYAKGVGYGLHCSMGIKWFQQAEGLVAPSGLGLVRWDCAPDGIEEGVEAAAAGWGSLGWVEGRGRAGVWPGGLGDSATRTVSAAGVKDFGATGAVGGAPRAAPPYSAEV